MSDGNGVFACLMLAWIAWDISVMVRHLGDIAGFLRVISEKL